MRVPGSRACFLVLFWVRISSDLGAVERLARTFLDLGRILLDFAWDLEPELSLILSVLPAVWAMSYFLGFACPGRS